ncbi:hypothetical protein TNCV_783691 [Trichonephila clavipes]|nr:hypothetical protein TNCV_783691 [Trichonephila clavipes]
MRNSGKYMCTPNRKTAHKSTSEYSDRCIRHLTIRDPFPTDRDIRCRLHLGADPSVSTQTILIRLLKVQLHARVPATGESLTATQG